MGDRTSVTLTVLKEQAQAAEALFDGLEPDHAVENAGVLPLVYFSFYEVNYGDLPFLDALQEAGIAFDSEWDHGSEYTAGIDFCRYRSDGAVQRYTYSEEYRNPSLPGLMKLLDDPDGLKAYIVDHYNNVTPEPWDNQIEYGKLYRTKNLITG